MNRFAVIIPYFGQFKPSIALFLESCKRNPAVDWLIFTDCDIPEAVTLTSNIHWHAATLESVSALAREKLKLPINLTRAYKLCDLKPFYGMIFADWLNGYEYWGFGDTDVIYGDVAGYLEAIGYTAYDKINWMAHLCFVRNTPECTQVALNAVPGTIEAEEVLLCEQNLGFDERDYNRKCLAAGMKLYNEKWAADIDIHYWRMRCADLKTFHVLLNTKEIRYAPKNYTKQVFVLLDGRTYRLYLKRGTVHFEEFAYIHFRKEAPIALDDVRVPSFVLSREGFFPLNYGERELENTKTVRELIERYNDQENALQELHTFWHYALRRLKKRNA